MSTAAERGEAGLRHRREGIAMNLRAVRSSMPPRTTTVLSRVSESTIPNLGDCGGLVLRSPPCRGPGSESTFAAGTPGLGSSPAVSPSTIAGGSQSAKDEDRMVRARRNADGTG